MKDRLEREYGPDHAVWCWKDDWRWPGSDKPKVAALTWVRVAGRGHGVVVRAADQWGGVWRRRGREGPWYCDANIPFMPSWSPQADLCVVRINLARRESQYLGWLSKGEYGALDVVRWGHPRNAVRRRVVLDWMLHRGLPPCVLGAEHRASEALGGTKDEAVCGGGSQGRGELLSE